MKMSIHVLTNFGAFVPGNGKSKAEMDKPTDKEKHHQPTGQGCQGYQCKLKCIGLADENWAQAVGSAIVRIAVQGTDSTKINRPGHLAPFAPELFNYLGHSEFLKYHTGPDMTSFVQKR